MWCNDLIGCILAFRSCPFKSSRMGGETKFLNFILFFFFKPANFLLNIFLTWIGNEKWNFIAIWNNWPARNSCACFSRDYFLLCLRYLFGCCDVLFCLILCLMSWSCLMSYLLVTADLFEKYNIYIHTHIF